jgi:hypothetical protein
MSNSANGPIASTVLTQGHLREKEAREAARRGALADARDRLDKVIDAAEELHLMHGGKPSTLATRELITQAREAIDHATSITGLESLWPDLGTREETRVGDVMDIIWDAQHYVMCYYMARERPELYVDDDEREL